VNSEDPTVRRRADREAMNERDGRAWKLQRQGFSVRAIARELGMAASSAQRCLERAARRQRQLELEFDAVAGHDDEGGLDAEQVTRPEQVPLLNDLERWRLRHFDPESPQGRALAAWVAEHPPKPLPPVAVSGQ